MRPPPVGVRQACRRFFGHSLRRRAIALAGWAYTSQVSIKTARRKFDGEGA